MSLPLYSLIPRVTKCTKMHLGLQNAQNCLNSNHLKTTSLNLSISNIKLFNLENVSAPTRRQDFFFFCEEKTS